MIIYADVAGVEAHDDDAQNNNYSRRNGGMG